MPAITWVSVFLYADLLHPVWEREHCFVGGRIRLTESVFGDSIGASWCDIWFAKRSVQKAPMSTSINTDGVSHISHDHSWARDKAQDPKPHPVFLPEGSPVPPFAGHSRVCVGIIVAIVWIVLLHTYGDVGSCLACSQMLAALSWSTLQILSFDNKPDFCTLHLWGAPMPQDANDGTVVLVLDVVKDLIYLHASSREFNWYLKIAY